jgi:hypothetical protein
MGRGWCMLMTVLVALLCAFPPPCSQHWSEGHCVVPEAPWRPGQPGQGHVRQHSAAHGDMAQPGGWVGVGGGSSDNHTSETLVSLIIYQKWRSLLLAFTMACGSHKSK